jgi:hypothetical protein
MSKEDHTKSKGFRPWRGNDKVFHTKTLGDEYWLTGKKQINKTKVIPSGQASIVVCRQHSLSQPIFWATVSFSQLG